jgi:signal peptidase II
MQERGASPPLSDGESRGGLWRPPVVAAVVAVVVVAVDQLTKSWAVHRLANGQIHVIWKLDLVLTYNSGSAFSLAQGWAPEIGAVAVIIVVVLLGVVRKLRSRVLAAAIGLVVGGALGNLTDRVVRGHHGAVVDFIALHFWPTFNVADSCIVVGSLWAAALLWRSGSPASAPAGDPVDGRKDGNSKGSSDGTSLGADCRHDGH